MTKAMRAVRGHRSKGSSGSRNRRRRHAYIWVSAAVAAGGIGALPAQASVTGGGVGDGRNITVFHNIDMVTTAGWTLGEEITVNVIRNGVTIGTAAGPARDPLGEGAGLEVNHGVDTAPAAGDCFEGTTPDIRPGDVVRVTNGTETDEVTVDDIRFSGPPAPDGNDVVVPVFAMRFDGTPFTAAELDAGEFRSPNFDLRANAGDDAGSVVVDEVDAATGQFALRYVAPFNFGRNRDNLTEEQIRTELLGDGHMIGFGHTEPPPGDAQLVEGIGDTPGPAAGCQGSPLAQRAVSQVTPGVLNIANQGTGLTVSGFSQDASEVTVTLDDGTTTPVDSEPVIPTPATGSQTWTTSFTAEQVAGLAEGNITVEATYTVTDDTGTDAILTGRNQTIVKDLAAPAAPSASIPGGSYLGRQDVSVTAGAEAQVRYTLGNGNQPDPTPTTGVVFTGAPIRITASQTLKMIAVDSAGNASPVVSESYAIDRRVTPARPSVDSVNPGSSRAVVVRWTPPSANGGPAVNRYRIRVFQGPRVVKTVTTGPRARWRTVRGLANGRRHRFTVQARNVVGFGVASAPSRVVVPRGAPTRPRIRRSFNGRPGGRDTARATWLAPRSNGGRRITGYRVTALRLRSNGTVASRQISRMLRPGMRSHNMPLASGRYRFQVRAYNAVGRSRLSPRSRPARSR